EHWPRPTSSATRSTARSPTWSRTGCCTCSATTMKRPKIGVACGSGRRRPFNRLASPVSEAPPSGDEGLGPRRRLGRLARSFGYAFEGLETIVRTQPNFWVHVLAACLALVLGVVLRLSPVEL